MYVTRRKILLGGGSLAALSACGGPPAAGPAPTTPGSARGASAPQPPAKPVTPSEAVDRALEAARAAGASYADARVVRRRTEDVAVRDGHVVDVSASESFGVGVRVIAAGAWGFAATARLEEAHDAARRAVAIAKANALVLDRPVELAPVAAYQGTWKTELRRDPFEVPLEEKVELLLSLWDEARAVPGIAHGSASFVAISEWKLFGSTEGSRIEQSITRVGPGFQVTAVDTAGGTFASRAHELPPRQAGWEYVASSSLKADARKIGEDAVAKMKAPTIDSKKRDLVLAPSNLWLVVHESVGHPTELDRAMGYEANFAGTSFATPDKLRKLEYAAKEVTLYADKTTPGGLATCGWDDDGVKTQKWNLVENGLFVGYQTTRDQAAWIGEKESRGCCYAQDFESFPFQRMPNVSLAPSEKGTTLEDMVAATDDGVLITGNGSWSIDHQRYNFQFGGQTFREIKNGKLGRVLRDVAYQSNTPEFWRSCDMIGGPASWELHGSINDGKGEPVQINPVSHGCPPARFRNVNVFSGAGAAKKG